VERPGGKIAHEAKRTSSRSQTQKRPGFPRKPRAFAVIHSFAVGFEEIVSGLSP